MEMEASPAEKAAKRARTGAGAGSADACGAVLARGADKLRVLDAELLQASRARAEGGGGGGSGVGGAGRDVFSVLSEITGLQLEMERSVGEAAGAAGDAGEGGGDGAAAARSFLEERRGVLDRLAAKVQAAEESLHACIEENRRAARGVAGAEIMDAKEAVEHIVAHAHRMSYTSFAPPGFQMGMQMRGFQPPHPMDQGMARSLLLRKAAEQAAQRATDAAAQRAAAAAAGGAAGPAAEEMSAQDMELLAMMPAGWKPGDPIPDLEALMKGEAVEAPPAPAAKPKPAAPAATVAVAVPKVSLDLNPEEGGDVVVEYSDYSEEEDSSDED